MRISHDYFENATRLTTRPDRGILLLGEVNPLGSTPEYALYPDPRAARDGDSATRSSM